MNTIKPSSSRLPLAEQCPSSLLQVENPVNNTSQAAKMGTAAHEGLALMVMGNDKSSEPLAELHGVDADELGFLLAMGRKAWVELAPHFPWSRAEVEFDETELLAKTKVDVLSISEDHISVLDWKTGRVEKNHSEQLMGYLYAATRLFGPRKKMTIATVWVRLGVYETKQVTEQEVDDFEERLAVYASRAGKVWNPGEHCGFCPGQYTCKARTESIGQAVAVFSGGTEITPAALAGLYPKVKELEQAIDTYKSLLRASLQNGPLPIDGERVLALTEYSKTELDPMKAWPVMAAMLEESEIAKVIDVSKTALVKAVCAKAARGQKKAAEESLMMQLESAGAVKTTTHQRVDVIKGEQK
jgi:hypothetical protein